MVVYHCFGFLLHENIFQLSVNDLLNRTWTTEPQNMFFIIKKIGPNLTEGMNFDESTSIFLHLVLVSVAELTGVTFLSKDWLFYHLKYYSWTSAELPESKVCGTLMLHPVTSLPLVSGPVVPSQTVLWSSCPHIHCILSTLASSTFFCYSIFPGWYSSSLHKI